MNVLDAKYFDYLPKFGAALQTRLGIDDLVKKINIWRKNGFDDPESVGSGCRNIIEKILNSLIANTSLTRTMTVEEKINFAKEKKLISASFAKKFHEIRKIGNKSAHDSIEFVNAKKSMVLLDEILRKYIYDAGISQDILYSIAIKNDSIFTILTDAEVVELNKKARTAAVLLNDSVIEQNAKIVHAIVEEQNEKTTQATDFINQVVEQINSEIDAFKLDETEAEKALVSLDEYHRKVSAKAKAVADKAQTIVKNVDTILNEYDFIKKLLLGEGAATNEQLEVLAFPRTSNTKTNVLQISGGAGTGKTLCLLAKLIRDIDEDIEKNKQRSMFGNVYKKALFVCFNRQLAGYVKNIAKNIPQAEARIEIVSFDQYINQLVKPSPSREFMHLADYAKDVRYPDHFGNKGLTYDRVYTQRAMENISRRYPKQLHAYYLNYAEYDNVMWVEEEIHWLEARYENVLEAEKHYLTAPRVGRGTARRPDENVRKIILQIWKNYCQQLKIANRYNIEQAVKRLMKSKQLPQYDLIAVDEVQDFTVLSIKLLLKFRKSVEARFYMSGDEGQKIYQRDFTWKELDSNVKGHTITLQKNMRNSYSIQAFARRLLGEKTAFEDASVDVSVTQGNNHRILQLAHELHSSVNETTVLIGDESWHDILLDANIAINNPKRRNAYGNMVDTKVGQIIEPGLYIIPELSNKGLEFDNVIIADAGENGFDLDLDKTLRYVHFTRARKKLYVFYYGNPSALLRQYYSDFLS